MCGLFGICSEKGVNESKFKLSLELLDHRGPDSTQTYFDNGISLGLTRLSIQDLSHSGTQPMMSSDERYVIVFNGEIYNYIEIKKDLIKNNINFTSESDTEVLLYALKEYGIIMTLKMLEGMFAFAFYDRKLKKLVLARDKFGQKPLFYRYNNKSIYFSSELKSIINYDGCSDVDVIGAANPMFTTGLSPNGMTCFKDINEIEAGSYLEFDLDSSSVTSKRYFHVSELVSSDKYNYYKKCGSVELLKEYYKVFDNSVKIHLRSDARIACLFSAGLDSSLIAAMSSKYLEIDLYHYESDFDDYSEYVSEFTHRFNLKCTFSKGGDLDYVKDLPKLLWHYETTNKSEGLALGNLTKLAREDGVKVLITGDAADEIFGGYNTATDFYNINRKYNNPTIRVMNKILRRLFPSSYNSYGDVNPLSLYNTTPFSSHLNEGPLNMLYHNGQRLNDWSKYYNSYDFISDKTEKSMNAFLLDDIGYKVQRYLVRSDRFGMMNSIEMRTPFLYTPIVELAVNTPIDYKLRKNIFGQSYTQKYIIKKLAEKVGVGKKISYRKKIGTPLSMDSAIIKIIKNWPLKNISQILRINAKTLIDIMLYSKDPELERLRYSMFSMELLIAMFVNGESYQVLRERICSIVD